MDLTPDVVARALHFQRVVTLLHNQLFRRLPKEAVGVVAGELGMVRDGQFIRKTPFDEFFILDYALHYSTRNGRTAIDDLLAADPPADAEQRRVLEALAASRLSLFRIDAVLPGVGVKLTDLTRKEEISVVSELLGRFDEKVAGMGLLARVMSVDEILFLSGAPLPLPTDQLAACQENFDSGIGVKGWGAEAARWSRQEEAAFAGSTIRCVRRLRSAAYTHDPDTCDDPSHDHHEDAPASVGRNDPCPCGSGRKFKKCCGKATGEG